MEAGKKQTKKINQELMKKCLICSQQYAEQNVHLHMHSYFHHKVLDQITGSFYSKQVHKCWACDKSLNTLQQYQKHVKSSKHKSNLIKLSNRHGKQTLTVDYNTELYHEIHISQTTRRQRHLQKCYLCCQSFKIQDLDKHMHSFVHHQAVEKLKGSKQLHKCWACNRSLMGLEEYKKHISTDYHKKQMLILNTDKDKSTMDYSAEFDDELKVLCAQRDQQKLLKKHVKRQLKRGKKKGLLKWLEKQNKMTQIKDMSQSVPPPIPAKAGYDFTSDDLPAFFDLYSSWDEQENISMSRPDQSVLKRRQESTAMDNFSFPYAKRPCPPSETFVPEELPCSHELVQRGDVSILLRTIHKSVDQGVNVGSEENVESHTKNEGERTCKSNHTNKLKEKNKRSKEKLNEKKKGLAKQKRSQAIQGFKKSKGGPCLHDVVPTMKHNQQNNMNTKRQQEQCFSRDNINGLQTPFASLPSVTSLNKKIERFCSQTPETFNVNVSQLLDLCGDDLCKFETDTHREQIIRSNAEKLQEDLRSFSTTSCSLKNQVISNKTHPNPETTSRKNEVNKLLTLSSREEELTNSLRNVGDQLFQAYATLQNAYAEVQHLLTVKQEVSSEMSSLRAKRIQLLQDMME